MHQPAGVRPRRSAISRRPEQLQLAQGRAQHVRVAGHDGIGIVSVAGSILLLAAFFRWATRKKDKALIDLRLFKGKVFSASAVTRDFAGPPRPSVV